MAPSDWLVLSQMILTTWRGGFCKTVAILVVTANLAGGVAWRAGYPGELVPCLLGVGVLSAEDSLPVSKHAAEHFLGFAVPALAGDRPG